MKAPVTETMMTLGTDWDGYSSVSGWLVTEKLDGCRAYWDGECLWTRSGNVIPAPAWFTDQLPAGVHLDGEIWCGRFRFQAASNAVRYGGRHWTARVRFVVFDAPQALGEWISRMTLARAVLRGCEVASVVELLGQVDDLSGLKRMFRSVQRAGGEGLMLRAPRVAGYETGRTTNLLKVKVWPR